jgi:aspartyl-tRNA(Asn)/glutamyl-tRNA(Gln) amidotransferase subunit C
VCPGLLLGVVGDGPIGEENSRDVGLHLHWPVMPIEIDVDHVARLARLGLTDEERERFRRQLGVILEHAERVREVAAADVPPTAQPVPQKNVFRNDDDPWESLPQDQALAGAPEAEDGRFKVPRIIEGD